MSPFYKNFLALFNPEGQTVAPLAILEKDGVFSFYNGSLNAQGITNSQKNASELVTLLASEQVFETTRYRLNANMKNYSLHTLMNHFVIDLRPTPEELVRLYTNCYYSSAIPVAIQADCPTKEHCKALVCAGADYQDIKGQLFYDICCAIKSLQNSKRKDTALTPAEIKSMLTMHMKNSRHTETIMPSDIMHGVNQLLKVRDGRYELSELLLSGLQPPNHEAGEVSVINLSAMDMFKAGEFTDLSTLHTFMEKTDETLDAFLGELGIRFIQHKYITQGAYYRFYIESVNDSAVRPEMVATLYLDMANLLHTANQSPSSSEQIQNYLNYLEDNPKILTDLVLFHKLNSDMNPKNTTSKRIKI